MGSLIYSPTAMTGVLAVETFFNDILGWMYRRQVEHDYGVDAEVELTEGNRRSTGILFKVQVKCGPSYLGKGDSENIWLYVDKEKMAYWEGLSLPLVLTIHDPAAKKTYWAHVTQATAHQTPTGWRINVPRHQILAKSSKAALEAIAKGRRGRPAAGQTVLLVNEQPSTPYLADALRAPPVEPETELVPLKQHDGPQGLPAAERPAGSSDSLSVDAALEAMSLKQILSLAAAQLRQRSAEPSTGPRDAEEPKLHAKIDSLRDINRAGSPKVAYDQLQALLKTIDADETPHAYYRAQSNLASAALDLGLTAEAVEGWEAAYRTEPENPHAVATLGLARLVQGQVQVARRLAEQALTGPAPDKSAASVLYQALAADPTWSGDPDDLIPEALRETPDVDLGRVEYLRRRRDPAWREAAIAAAKRHPDEDIFRYAAAHAVLDQASPFSDPTRPLDQRIDPADLRAAAKTLEDRAEAWLRDDYKDLHELEAYANNAAVAYRLLGDFEAARRLIDRVLSTHPDMAGLRKLQGVIEAIDGDRRRAIEILALVPDDGEAQLYRAELMSETEPEAALKAVLSVADETVPPEHKTTRWLIAGAIALRLRDRENLDRAMAEIIKDPARALFAEVFAIEWDWRHGLDQEVVQSRLVEVAVKLDAGANLSTRASLADLLCRHQLWYEASECLDGFVNLRQPDEITIVYFQALAAARRDKRFLAVLAEADDAVRSDPAIIRTVALHAYNAGELGVAEGHARRLVKARPEALEPVLILLDILARRDERRAINKVLARDLEALTADTIDERIKLARYLFVFGERGRSLRYAYWLSWRYGDDRRAVMAQCFQTLEATRRDTSGAYNPTVVASDVLVEIDADGEVISFVIEPDAELRRLNGQAWAPSHPSAVAAEGKAVGEAVTLPDSEVGLIKSIRHKYVARMQEAFQTLHRRFPDNKSFQRLKVNPEVEGGLDKIYATAKSRADAVDAALGEYKAGRALLSMLALQLGATTVDVVEGMSFGGTALINATGSIEERHVAADAMAASLGKGFVIDTATFWCLWRLKALDAVIATFGQMHVASIIFDELGARREFLEPHATDGLQQLGYLAGRPTITETSAETIRQAIGEIDEAVAWLKANARVCPAHTPETIPDGIARSVGQMRFHFLDELFVAINQDLLLISDDQRLRAMSAEVGPIRSTWSQWALGMATDEKKASFDQYVDWSAKLVAMGHAYIGVMPKVLVRGLQMDLAEGVARAQSGRFRWLVRALGGRAAEPVSHMRVLCGVIYILWRRTQFAEVREFATGLLLERLVVERDDSAMLVNALGEIFDEKPDILNYIRGWLQGHFLLPW